MVKDLSADLVDHLKSISPSDTPFMDAAKPALKAQVGGDHYKNMAIQPVEYCIKNNIPFVEGNVIKYVSRWRNKGGVKDLKKARHMLDVLIEANEEPTVAP